MDQPTRSAVVGCGAIAHEHLGFLARESSIDLVGVCDTSPATADYAATTYHSTGFTDLDKMLERVEPDVVHVLTPPLSHVSLVGRCLESADVVCEKPLAPTGTEIARLLDIAANNGHRLIESQNLRYNDGVIKARTLAENGQLGTITSVDVLLGLEIAGPGSRFADTNVPSAVRDLPGGAIHDFLPHMAYLAIDALGYPAVTDVTARWRNRSGNTAVKYDELVGSGEAGDAVITLQFNGRIHPTCFRLTVRGTDGTYETDMYHPYERFEPRRGSDKLASPINHVVNGARLLTAGPRGLVDKVMQHGVYHGLPRMLSAFYEARISGAPTPISPSDIRRTADLVDALVAGATS